MAIKKQEEEIEKIDLSPKEILIASMHNMFNGHYTYACWKRKTSIAKVRLYQKWDWTIIINGKPASDSITNELLEKIKVPLSLTWNKNIFNITIKVIWWWVISQADAIRHWISRALIAFNPDLKTTLKKDGHLTRDPRVKERKKPGLKRARKAPTWVKR